MRYSTVTAGVLDDYERGDVYATGYRRASVYALFRDAFIQVIIEFCIFEIYFDDKNVVSVFYFYVSLLVGDRTKRTLRNSRYLNVQCKHCIPGRTNGKFTKNYYADHFQMTKS